MAAAATRPAPARATGPAVQVSERERDVLTLVLRGLSYAQIAGELFISQRTVGFHLSNMYAKAYVKSRHELTELARREPARFRLAPELVAVAHG